MEDSRSPDTPELGVFLLALQEAFKSAALGSLLQGSLSRPKPPASSFRQQLHPQAAVRLHRQKQAAASSWPPVTLRTAAPRPPGFDTPGTKHRVSLMRLLSTCRALLGACPSRRGPVQRGTTFTSPLTAFSRPVKSAGLRTGWVPGRLIISRSSWELQAGRCRETSPPARSCHPTAPGCLPQARLDHEQMAAGARTARFTQPCTERLSPQGKGSLGSGAGKKHRPPASP